MGGAHRIDGRLDMVGIVEHTSHNRGHPRQGFLIRIWHDRVGTIYLERDRSVGCRHKREGWRCPLDLKMMKQKHGPSQIVTNAVTMKVTMRDSGADSGSV